MTKISQKEQKFIGIFLKKPRLASSAVRDELFTAGEDISLVTIKRTLSQMAAKRLLEKNGSGRATTYGIATLGRVFADVDAEKYSAIEPDKRYGLSSFNFKLLPEFPEEVFTEKNLKVLDEATAEYRKRTANLPASIQKKEDD